MNECAVCPSQKVNNAFIFMGVLVALLGSIAMIYSTLTSEGRPDAPAIMLIKIAFSHLQLISVAASFDLVWPSEILNMFYIFDMVGGAGEKLFSLGCVSQFQKGIEDSRFLLNALLFAFFPFVCVFMVCLGWGMIYSFQKNVSRKYTIELKKCSWKKRRANAFKELPKFPTEQIAVSLLVIMFLLHPMLTRWAISLFTCRTLGVTADGTEHAFLVKDLSFQCYTPKHQLWMYALGVPYLLFYAIGIPLAAFLVLFHVRDKLDEKETQAVLGFLYSGFKKQYFYYECVVSMRKVAMLSVSVLFR